MFLLYDGKDRHVLIHVPMTAKNSLLCLFQLHCFLLLLFDMHVLIPDIKSDTLAIMSTNTCYNIQLSSTDLLFCHLVSQIFMCNSFGMMLCNFNNTCPMFVERKVYYSALFTNLVGWHNGAVSFHPK
jgi:hypothetical protein